MNLKNIKKLESLLSALVDEVRSLRAQNLRLKEDSVRMADKVGAISANEKKYRDKMERLAILERSCHKMETGNADVRLKIQSMLAELEKIDLS